MFGDYFFVIFILFILQPSLALLTELFWLRVKKICTISEDLYWSTLVFYILPTSLFNYANNYLFKTFPYYSYVDCLYTDIFLVYIDAC